MKYEQVTTDYSRNKEEILILIQKEMDNSVLRFHNLQVTRSAIYDFITHEVVDEPCRAILKPICHNVTALRIKRIKTHIQYNREFRRFIVSLLALLLFRLQELKFPSPECVGEYLLPKKLNKQFA